ncbi:MAG: LptF/LptG family permease, partial [Candidatus Cardinium sp.]|nr:LptF/LptG family permease [Candidatus Cardinium sp.]
MKLIDTYIYRKFFSTFLVALSITTLLIIFIHLTENVNHLKKEQLSYKQIGHYYCLLLPYMLSLLMPIIVFGTTIWVTTRLAQRSEIIALLSGGISFHRILLPYFMVACLLTAANFYLTGWLLATTNKSRLAFESKYLNNTVLTSNPPAYIHLKVGSNQYLHVNTYYPYSHTGYHVCLDTFQHATLIERIQAAKIKWDPESQTWVLRSWQRRLFSPKKETLTEGDKLKLPLAVDPEDFSINPRLREGLTISELDLHIQKLLLKGNDSVRFFVAEKYTRYMTPFAVIILIVLGFLVAVHKPRGGVGRQITLGFVLAGLYITLFLSAKIITETQSNYPLLEIWLPNIIFSL